MDHSEATATQAAEKYLLGELPEAERSSFEEHFFECQECASDVEAGVLFADTARAVFREQKPLAEPARSFERDREQMRTPARARSPWRAFADLFRRPLVPQFAALALAAVSLYQGLVVIPGLKYAVENLSSARPLPAFQLFQAVRGTPPNLSVPAGAGFFALNFDPAWDRAYPQYLCELIDSRGSRRFSITAPAPRLGQPVSILVPARDLADGSYRLAVSPGFDTGGGQPLASYAFDLNFEE
jgi:hypothetical protein